MSVILIVLGCVTLGNVALFGWLVRELGRVEAAISKREEDMLEQRHALANESSRLTQDMYDLEERQRRLVEKLGGAIGFDPQELEP